MADLYSDKDLREWVIPSDGLEYAVRHKCDSRHISDPETGKLWDEAATALDKLCERLGLDE
jgi:hypothetical protein